MKVAIVFVFTLLSSTAALGQASRPGVYYVKVGVLEERLAPSSVGSITNRIYLRQQVEVFELQRGWARVSKYYDGSLEGKDGEVARWVLASGLSASLPKELDHPKAVSDPRIAKGAIPQVGENRADSPRHSDSQQGRVEIPEVR